MSDEYSFYGPAFDGGGFDSGSVDSGNDTYFGGADSGTSNDEPAFDGGQGSYNGGSPIQQAIVAAAKKNGIDPSWALSVAERESNFDPNAKASKTIRGVFQMTKGLRDQYGAGDSTDPAVQAEAFMKYANAEIKPQMASVLGRDPTPQEMYLGHHFGGVRAARMIASGQGNTPVTDVFTAQEMAGNPHFGRAGTTGNLMNSINADMSKRMAKYGGSNIPMAGPGGSGLGNNTIAANAATTPMDYSMFGPQVGSAPAESSAEAPKSKQVAMAKQPEIEHDDTGLGTIKQAVAPVVPQKTSGGGLPSLPSLQKSNITPTQADILKGKPGLVGALSPLIGQVG